MFLKVHLKKMCGFVNFILKLIIYVFSSRFKEIQNSKYDISSFLKKNFKDQNFFFYVYEVLL
jgi:hypothetical protein